MWLPYNCYNQDYKSHPRTEILSRFDVLCHLSRRVVYFQILYFRATLQFCFLKPPMAIVTIILATKGLYSEGNWDPTQGKFHKMSSTEPKIDFLP